MLVCRRGSEAHGTYLAPTNPDSIDDRDIMGICIPPLRYYFGLNRWEGSDAINECWDVVLYEFRKFVGLLTKQNPNVLSMLWLRPEDYLYQSEGGKQLVANRKMFTARTAAYRSFVGYAEGQLKRMTHFQFQGYMGEKRKQLVEKYGYDCKNAAHLIRLLHMGKEFLDTGEMQVYRTWDRDLLLEIKTGKWPLERVHSYTESAFESCKKAYLSSCLPEHIDVEAVEELTTRTIRQHLDTELVHSS
jgi:predicted nucleotidyltransferase